MSQVMAMAQRLQEAKETIARLQSQSHASSAEDTRSHRSPSPIAAEPATGLTRPPFSSPAGPGTVSPAGTIPTKEPSTFHSRDQFNNTPMEHIGASKEGAPPDLSVDGNGEIQYYEPTSAVHDPPQLQQKSPLTQVSPSASSSSSKTEIVSALMAHAQESKIWEDYALGNASLQTGMPRQIIAKLLHMHWIWVSPMFMYVYRPAFIRDMATGGRYYSELLLIVICAHAAKYQDGNYAKFLMTRALLQLSAREIANGSISQAWVYSGIAFRMASDLGLEYIGPNIKGLDPVDLEIRKRLFWSCYFWDK
ncbi:hypothetical protein N0V90_009916 [Kalmusia sp. IMI 367209]|nr:hypothetical protein N0V90_009916 [Kalmusia sp. IMI 367209]